MHNPLTHALHLSQVRACLTVFRARMDEIKSEPSRTAQRVSAGVLITLALETVARLLPLDVRQEVEALVVAERAFWEMQPTGTQPAQAKAAAQVADLCAIYGPAARHTDYTIGETVTFLNVMETEAPQVETGILLYVCAPTEAQGQHLPLCYVVGQYDPGSDFPRPYFITARFLLGTCHAAL